MLALDPQVISHCPEILMLHIRFTAQRNHHAKFWRSLAMPVDLTEESSSNTWQRSACQASSYIILVDSISSISQAFNSPLIRTSFWGRCSLQPTISTLWTCYEPACSWSPPKYGRSLHLEGGVTICIRSLSASAQARILRIFSRPFVRSHPIGLLHSSDAGRSISVVSVAASVQ